MSVGFALFCLVAVGIPLGILYALFGRAPRGQPVTVVRRASLAAIPQVAPVRQTYEPERAFAYEQQVLLENARKVIQVVPRGGATPPPLPRSRVPRGSDGPALRHETARSADRDDPTNPFGDEGPTMFGDLR
jgi:hypothetical protein